MGMPDSYISNLFICMSEDDCGISEWFIWRVLIQLKILRLEIFISAWE